MVKPLRINKVDVIVRREVPVVMRVVGSLLENTLYVSIEYEHGPCLATINIRQMDALVRRWRKAMRREEAADA